MNADDASSSDASIPRAPIDPRALSARGPPTARALFESPSSHASPATHTPSPPSPRSPHSALASLAHALHRSTHPPRIAMYRHLSSTSWRLSAANAAMVSTTLLSIDLRVVRPAKFNSCPNEYHTPTPDRPSRDRRFRRRNTVARVSAAAPPPPTAVVPSPHPARHRRSTARRRANIPARTRVRARSRARPALASRKTTRRTKTRPIARESRSRRRRPHRHRARSVARARSTPMSSIARARRTRDRDDDDDVTASRCDPVPGGGVESSRHDARESSSRARVPASRKRSREFLSVASSVVMEYVSFEGLRLDGRRRHDARRMRHDLPSTPPRTGRVDSRWETPRWRRSARSARATRTARGGRERGVRVRGVVRVERVRDRGRARASTRRSTRARARGGAREDS